MLLWLADPAPCAATRAVAAEADAELLASSFGTALVSGTWSVADVALVDDLAARLGPVQEKEPEERGFYEIEELDDLSQYGVTEVQPVVGAARARRPAARAEPRDRLLPGASAGRRTTPTSSSTRRRTSPPCSGGCSDAVDALLVDRRRRRRTGLLARRHRGQRAREEAFGTQARRLFHMDTNYRNAREIFDYAADVVRREVPDADIPQAVRETGIHPVDAPLARTRSRPCEPPSWSCWAGRGLDRRHHPGGTRRPAPGRPPSRPVTVGSPTAVQVVAPMSTKGLEYDATVVVDPERSSASRPVACASSTWR